MFGARGVGEDAEVVLCSDTWSALALNGPGVRDGHGGDAILIDGSVAGSTASVAYGHTYWKVLAFAYVKPHVNVPGQEIEVFVHRESRPGCIRGEAVYDPESNLPRTDA